MTRKTAEEHVQTIQRLAEEKWGTELNRHGKPEWQARLVARFVELYNEGLEEGVEEATTLNRRSQVLRTFERGSCGLDTAILLYAAVDCEVRIVQERTV